jgi:hypothetical protein
VTKVQHRVVLEGSIRYNCVDKMRGSKSESKLHAKPVDRFMRSLGFRVNLLSIVLIGCAAGAVTWSCVRWWAQHNPQDFEQCSDQAEMTASSKDERMTLLAQCGKQFVGRRKIGGGYIYYDVLQNRQFDIAAPNPTPKEQKYFDEQYMLYLDVQKLEADAAARAERQNRMAHPAPQDDRVAGAIVSLGPPLVITPMNVPMPSAPSLGVRSGKVCKDRLLSCNWAKFSAGLKKFLESNANGNRH